MKTDSSSAQLREAADGEGRAKLEKAAAIGETLLG